MASVGAAYPRLRRTIGVDGHTVTSNFPMSRPPGMSMPIHLADRQANGKTRRRPDARMLIAVSQPAALRRYGMPETVVSANRAAFEREVERYCHEVLAPKPASDYMIEFTGRPGIPDMSASADYPTHPRLRPLADAALPTVPVAHGTGATDVAGGHRRMPAAVRHRFGIPWTGRRTPLPDDPGRHPQRRHRQALEFAGTG